MNGDPMAIAASPPVPDISRRVLRLQVFTIIWMSVEAVVSLGAAWTSRSPALLAFGGDSAVELLSAAVVFWRFRSNSSPSLTEKRAARIAGGLLFALAAYVVLVSVLSFLGYREAQPSIVGIVLLVLAAMVMPWLASQKRKLAILTSSASLKADAVESALCGYLAWIALGGLAANVIWGKSWADPLAALGLTPLIIREGWDAVRSNRPKCC
jgi:divalent metal cation (Fe/Co/Zn/Cd) transporter